MTIHKKEYFHSLAGIRAISAFLVYLHHFNPLPIAIIGEKAFKILRETHIGVSIFFCLSGFLITYRYYNLHSFNYKSYIINRIARIYPVYFMLSILTFVAKPEVFGGTFVLFILNITFLKGFFHEFLFTGIAQGWSLTVEETFYFLAPLFFILIKRNRFYIFLLPILFFLIGWFLVQIFQTISFHGFFDSMVFMGLYTFFGRSFEFFTGIGLALYFLNNPAMNSGFKFTTCGVLILVICLASISYFSGGVFTYGVFHPCGIILNNFVLPLFSISILFYGLLTEKTWLSSFLSTKYMVLLGKSSFVFYLIHLGFISDLIFSFTKNLIVHFLCLNFVSITIYALFENPLNNFLRKIFSAANSSFKLYK